MSTEEDRKIVVAACKKLMNLNVSHSLAEFGCFREAKAIASLVYDALEPPPTRIVVLTRNEIQKCAESLLPAAAQELKDV